MATKKKKTKRSTKAKPAASRRVAKKRSGGAAARAKPAARKVARKTARKTASKAAPRRAAARKPRAKAAAKPAVRRRDRAGHLDPKYARELRERGGRPEVEPRSFVVESRANDDLAEELAEEALETATSGEYDGEDRLNAEVPEDVGGPFVQSTAGQEFAHGTDASNPKGSKKEPFPTT